MYIFIKNMVCVRCKMIVKSVLENLEIPYSDVELGRVKVFSELSSEQRTQLNSDLNYYELELLDNSKKILVERIKVVIIEMFHSDGDDILLKFSEHLSKSLQYDYTYLANTFSELEGSTIEKFYIFKKIERVKELIKYEGLNVKEISFQLSYSSVSHLCQQFKKITGVTPAEFKKSWKSENYV
ncbi:MAG: helix-turn-helix domain-containing protein [Chitinophagaceae bacterium]